ncbi:unnamed protein product [Rotaria magnacalcarata]
MIEFANLKTKLTPTSMFQKAYYISHDLSTALTSFMIVRYSNHHYSDSSHERMKHCALSRQTLDQIYRTSNN